MFIENYDVHNMTYFNLENMRFQQFDAVLHFVNETIKLQTDKLKLFQETTDNWPPGSCGLTLLNNFL